MIEFSPKARQRALCSVAFDLSRCLRVLTFLLIALAGFAQPLRAQEPGDAVTAFDPGYAILVADGDCGFGPAPTTFRILPEVTFTGGQEGQYSSFYIRGLLVDNDDTVLATDSFRPAYGTYSYWKEFTVGYPPAIDANFRIKWVRGQDDPNLYPGATLPAATPLLGTSIVDSRVLDPDCVEVDDIPPTVTISRDQPAVTNADVVSWTLTFSEPVRQISSGSFDMVGGVRTSKFFTVIDNRTYRYTLSGGDLPNYNGRFWIEPPLYSYIEDFAGNRLDGNLGSPEPWTYTLDNIAPSVTVSTRQGRDESWIVASFALSEDLPFTLGDITLPATLASAPSPAWLRRVAGTNTWEIALQLRPGPFTVGVAAGTLSDAAGNVNAAASANGVIVDTTPPETPAVSPGFSDEGVSTSDGVIATRDLSFTLFGGDDSQAELLFNGSVVASKEHRFLTRIGATATADGTVTVAVRVSDEYGNAVTVPAGTFVIDTAAWEVSSIARRVPSAAATSADSLTFEVTFSEPVHNVTAADFAVIAPSGQTATTATVTNVTALSERSFAVTVSGGDLPDLEADVGIELAASPGITDTAGNGGASLDPAKIVFYNVYNAPLETPGAPDLAAASDTGLSPTDDITNADTLVFTGVAPRARSVDLYRDATLVGTAATDGGGNWSLAVARTEMGGDGDHAMQAKGRDPRTGRETGFGPELIVRVDTAPSGAAAVMLDGDTGTSPSDGITSSRTGTFRITTEPQTALRVYTDPATEEATIPAALNPTGTVSVVVTVPESVSDGIYTVYAVTTDAADNVSGAIELQRLTLDRTPPTIDSARIAAADDSGESNSDGLTNVALPKIEAVLTGASEARLVLEGEPGEWSPVSAGGAWSATPHRAPGGAYRIEAHDLAWNVAGADFTYDYRPDPMVGADPLVVQNPPAILPDGTILHSAFEQLNVNWNITGAISDVVAAHILDGDVVLAILDADAASGTKNLHTRSEGTYVLRLRVEDRAGNLALSAPITVEVDGTPPGIFGAPDFPFAPGSDTGSDTTDRITATADPRFLLTASEAITVNWASKEVPSVQGSFELPQGGPTEVTLSGIPDGTHTLQVEMIDRVGTGNAFMANSFTIDTRAPAAPGAALMPGSDTGVDPADGVTADATPEIAVDHEAGAKVELTLPAGLSGVSVLSERSDGPGRTILTLGGPATGALAVDVAARDVAGNLSATTRLSFTRDLAAPLLTATLPDGVQNGPFTVTLTGSEPIFGLETADFDVTGGTVTGVSGAGADWTLAITPNGTRVTLALKDDAATDAAGNAAVMAAGEVTADLTPPVLALAVPAAVQTGRFDVTITASEAVSGLEIGDVIVTGGTAESLAETGAAPGAEWTLSVTPTADMVQIVLPAGAARDVGGNPSGRVAAQVRADIVAPVAIIELPAGPLDGPVSGRIRLSEPVMGFDSSGIVLANATVSGVTVVSDGVTFILTPDHSDPITIDIPAGTFTDLAGNPGAPVLLSLGGAAPRPASGASVPVLLARNPAPAPPRVDGFAVTLELGLRTAAGEVPAAVLRRDGVRVDAAPVLQGGKLVWTLADQEAGTARYSVELPRTGAFLAAQADFADATIARADYVVGTVAAPASAYPGETVTLRVPVGPAQAEGALAVIEAGASAFSVPVTGGHLEVSLPMPDAPALPVHLTLPQTGYMNAAPRRQIHVLSRSLQVRPGMTLSVDPDGVAAGDDLAYRLDLADVPVRGLVTITLEVSAPSGVTRQSTVLDLSAGPSFPYDGTFTIPARGTATLTADLPESVYTQAASTTFGPWDVTGAVNDLALAVPPGAVTADRPLHIVATSSRAEVLAALTLMRGDGGDTGSPVLGNGTATWTFVPDRPGRIEVTLDYPGSDLLAPMRLTRAVAVVVPDYTVDLSLDGAALVGAPMTLVARVAPVPPPGATVTFADESGPIATVAGDDTGRFTTTHVVDSARAVTVTAGFARNPQAVPVLAAPLSVDVSRRATEVALNLPPGPYLPDTPLELTARLTPAAGTGRVIFLNGEEEIGRADLNAGAARITARLPQGESALRARYAGDPRHAPSVSEVVVVHVTTAQDVLDEHAEDVLDALAESGRASAGLRVEELRRLLRDARRRLADRRAGVEPVQRGYTWSGIDPTGTIEVSAGRSRIAGQFAGNGTLWGFDRYLSGDFTLHHEDGVTTGQVGAMLLLERALGPRASGGFVLGVDIARAEVDRVLDGTIDRAGLSLGAYAVTSLSHDLYLDGFVLGTFSMGQADLAAADGTRMQGGFDETGFAAGVELSGAFPLGKAEVEMSLGLIHMEGWVDPGLFDVVSGSVSGTGILPDRNWSRSEIRVGPRIAWAGADGGSVWLAPSARLRRDSDGGRTDHAAGMALELGAELPLGEHGMLNFHASRDFGAIGSASSLRLGFETAF